MTQYRCGEKSAIPLFFVSVIEQNAMPPLRSIPEPHPPQKKKEKRNTTACWKEKEEFRSLVCFRISLCNGDQSISPEKKTIKTKIEEKSVSAVGREEDDADSPRQPSLRGRSA